MARVTRIDELTLAVLNGDDDDELLDYLMDASFSDLHADTLMLLLPAGPRAWSCEVVRGRYRDELMGRDVRYEPEAPGRSSRMARTLDSQNAPGFDLLTWEAISRTLTGHYLDPYEQDDLPIPGTLWADGDRRPHPEAPTPQVLTRVVEAGRDAVGLLIAVRFPAGSEQTADASFDRESTILADALASVMSFALNNASARSVIEDDVATERDRIARDLHDLAIQELFAAGMQLESAAKSAERFQEFRENGPVAESLRQSMASLENSIAQIRHIVQSLRNESDELTLTQLIRHECAMAIAGLGFAPSLQFHSSMDDLDATNPELTADVVAVVRECLANAARHAHASAVAVTVTVLREGVDRVVQVNVSDNGRGIDPSVTRRSGLANMRSRARRHAGWVDVYPLEPGTMVSWRATEFAS
ncbi:histidine kinase [Helcobacillus massiliensis]|uniref:sensor histidine kinase n=1 Tax=Helcobacillus massiliensis TaxID=521392 RepID=UPI002553B89A|nr:histidine kinase [Helcobacillus massiliensis]MDK7742142.1 histidine kinase [Helcobacillus massiliensis]